MEDMSREDLERTNRELLARRADQRRQTPTAALADTVISSNTARPARQHPAREEDPMKIPEDVWADARTREKAEREAAEHAAFQGECFECRDTGWPARLVWSLWAREWKVEHSHDNPCTCRRGHVHARKRHAEQVEAIWSAADIPPRQRDLRLDTYPAKRLEAFALVRDFLGGWDGRRGLILVGLPSTGKTGLMVGLMRDVAERYAGTPNRMRFVPSVEFLQALRASYGKSDADHGALLDKAMRVRLLALDDLGTDKPTDWVRDRLYTLVNHRYNHELPTFVTTNYGPEDLVERVGQAIVDRLLETCDLVVMDPDAPNLRTGR